MLTVLTHKAQAWITELEREPLAEQWAVQVVLLKASLAMHNDDDSRCVSLLESLQGRALEVPFLQQVRIGLTLNCLALRGQHAQARSLFRQPEARCLRSDDEMALMGQLSMASVSLLEGKVLEAERLCAPLLEQAEAVHGRRSVSAVALPWLWLRRATSWTVWSRPVRCWPIAWISCVFPPRCR